MDNKKISIIVITLNEEFFLWRLLKRINGMEDIEVIVSDGGSTDRTYGISNRYADKLVMSGKGRGKQLNEGAKYATGDIFLFLHADSTLPENFHKKIMATLEDPDVVGGSFDFEIDSKKAGCRIISMMASLRSRVLRIPFGDQGIFVKKEIFRKMNGFSDIPLMEDVDFFRRLRKEGKTKVMKDKIKSSARLWKKKGLVKTTLRNWISLTLFFLGYSPVKLYYWYYQN